MTLLSWWRSGKKKKEAAPEQPVRVLSYQCAVVQGLGSREQQEDAWKLVNASDVSVIRQEGILALVADGMGGMEDGALASATGIRVMEDDFRKMDRQKPLPEQLVRSLRHAADEVCGLLQGNGGSTMIACMLYQEKLCYAGVGDSYLYLLRNGSLIRINREQNVLHKRYLEWIQDGLVEASAGEGVSQPHAIIGFLGAKSLEDIDSLRRPMPLENGDVLLLCSDGVGGVLSPEEVREILSCGDANRASAALHQSVLAKNRKHQDNFTAIVICCKK